MTKNQINIQISQLEGQLENFELQKAGLLNLVKSKKSDSNSNDWEVVIKPKKRPPKKHKNSLSNSDDSFENIVPSYKVLRLTTRQKKVLRVV